MSDAPLDGGSGWPTSAYAIIKRPDSYFSANGSGPSSPPPNSPSNSPSLPPSSPPNGAVPIVPAPPPPPAASVEPVREAPARPKIKVPRQKSWLRGRGWGSRSGAVPEPIAEPTATEATVNLQAAAAEATTNGQAAATNATAQLAAAGHTAVVAAPTPDARDVDAAVPATDFIDTADPGATVRLGAGTADTATLGAGTADTATLGAGTAANAPTALAATPVTNADRLAPDADDDRTALAAGAGTNALSAGTLDTARPTAAAIDTGRPTADAIDAADTTALPTSPLDDHAAAIVTAGRSGTGTADRASANRAGASTAEDGLTDYRGDGALADHLSATPDDDTTGTHTARAGSHTAARADDSAASGSGDDNGASGIAARGDETGSGTAARGDETGSGTAARGDETGSGTAARAGNRTAARADDSAGNRTAARGDDSAETVPLDRERAVLDLQTAEAMHDLREAMRSLRRSEDGASARGTAAVIAPGDAEPDDAHDHDGPRPEDEAGTPRGLAIAAAVIILVALALVVYFAIRANGPSTDQTAPGGAATTGATGAAGVVEPETSTAVSFAPAGPDAAATPNGTAAGAPDVLRSGSVRLAIGTNQADESFDFDSGIKGAPNAFAEGRRPDLDALTQGLWAANGAHVAVWTKTGSPTAADCRRLPDSDWTSLVKVEPALVGPKVCVQTSEGRAATFVARPIDVGPDGGVETVYLDFTVWKKAGD